MPLDPRTPVLIGQGQALDRNIIPREAKHPVSLMADAVRAAAADADISLPSVIDSVRVVRLLSWKYSNAAHALAQACGITANEYAGTPHGGNMPQTLVNTTARQVAAGEVDFVVLAGGECTRTRSAVKDAALLPWPALDDAPPATHIVEDLALLNEEETRLGIMLPVSYTHLTLPTIYSV